MKHTDAYPWNILNVEKIPQYIYEVKRAYAHQLKQIDRNNVNEFQSLQQAYKAALAIVDDAPPKETLKKAYLKENKNNDKKEKLSKANLRDLSFSYEEEPEDEEKSNKHNNGKQEEIYEYQTTSQT